VTAAVHTRCSFLAAFNLLPWKWKHQLCGVIVPTKFAFQLERERPQPYYVCRMKLSSLPTNDG